MINNFNDGVFNELYDIRSENYELCFSEKLTKETEKFEVSEKRENLKNFINELDFDKDIMITNESMIWRKCHVINDLKKSIKES
mgnify:CR=1 FL=1